MSIDKKGYVPPIDSVAMPGSELPGDPLEVFEAHFRDVDADLGKIVDDAAAKIKNWRSRMGEPGTEKEKVMRIVALTQKKLKEAAEIHKELLGDEKLRLIRLYRRADRRHQDNVLSIRVKTDERIDNIFYKQSCRLADATQNHIM